MILFSLHLSIIIGGEGGSGSPGPSRSYGTDLFVHLLAFFDFLPKRLMFPQIIRSTQLDTPRLQQSRKTRTRYDCLFFEKNYYKARAQTFSRGQRCWGSMQIVQIVALRFAGHRTIEMLGLVRPKVWPVSNCTQQVPKNANIVVVPCKRTQVTTMLGVVGQQCWVRLHGP